MIDWLPGQVQVTRQPAVELVPVFVTVTVAWKPPVQELSTWRDAEQLLAPPDGGGVMTGGALGVMAGLAVAIGVGVGVTPPDATVMPLIFGFWVPEMNPITTWPLLLAVVPNVRAMARFCPPAAA